MAQSVLILLAPSKTMDFTSPLPLKVEPQKPLFLNEASVITSKLRTLGPRQIAKLMSISTPIAESVKQRLSEWTVEAEGKPALWAYKGDVYKGVRANQLDLASAEWAQQYLLILSGLYGLVRPYDGIQGYRLEMKSRLKIGRPNDLYQFWGNKLSTYLEGRGSDWICCLSSDEYARAALKTLSPNVTLITPVFFDTKPNGTIGTVPIYSKMMRGVMARWMIDQRVTSPKDLEAFDGQGYTYDPGRSRPGFPAFHRKVMTPLRFV